MQTTELRVGNYVLVNGKQEKVFSISIDGINHTIDTLGHFPVTEFEKTNSITPIPITEDWLVKFGFQKVENDIHYLYQINDRLYFVRSIGGGLHYFEMHDKRLHMIKFIHQLQNIYSALNDEDLKITQLSGEEKKGNEKAD